jgi:predicted TIM-barrel fold metal-dependent hydrolase
MQLIDAQIHAMLGGKAFDGLAGDRLIATSADLAVASMDAVGVQAAAVNWRDLDLVKGYIERYPDRFAGVPTAITLSLDGKFNTVITHEDSPEDYVARIRETPGMVGIRLGISYGAMIDWYRAGVHEPYFVAAERNGLPIFIALHGHATEFEATIKAHPGVRFIVDHVGLPTPPNGAQPGQHLFVELPSVLALARFPNVAVKFTGVPALSAEPYPFADVWPHMRKLVDAFGADRLMWGTDFTRCKELHTYRDSVNFFVFTDQLSDMEKEEMGSGTFRRWLSWPGE